MAIINSIKVVDKLKDITSDNNGGIVKIKENGTGFETTTISDLTSDVLDAIKNTDTLSIGSDQIGDGAVTNSELASGAVTPDKLKDYTSANNGGIVKIKSNRFYRWYSNSR